MKRVPEEGFAADTLFEDAIVEPVVGGFIRDWDAMEDLLHHVLYSGLGWEIGNEGQILFTDPLCTPKVSQFSITGTCFSFVATGKVWFGFQPQHSSDGFHLVTFFFFP